MPIASIEAGASHMQYRPQLTGCPALAVTHPPTSVPIESVQARVCMLTPVAAGSFIDPAISAISITLLVGIALISRGVNRFVFLSGIGRLL